MTCLLAYDLLRDGIPGPVGLAIIALVGYLVGRIQRRPNSTTETQARREIKRAYSVAKSLEKIATDIRKDLARHRASLDRFKVHIQKIDPAHTEEDWRQLCAEAEHILGPTMQLASQIAHSYDQIRQQTNQLMTFTEVRTDALTGVCNRRAMDDTIASMTAMKNRYDLDFSIALFDIDYFKRINDEQGHLAGDAVLKAVAKLMDEAARETDVVARYGGEEFVVIMPHTDLHGAAVFAERLRTLIETNLHVTLSGGVTTALGNDETPQLLLERADAAMYAAKQAGRNRNFLGTGRSIEPIILAHEAHHAEA